MKIANVEINKNDNGLYSLNDLHKASGGDVSKRPAQWLRTDRATRLIKALESDAHLCTPLQTVHGDGGGTFGGRHVLVAYSTYLSVEMEILVQQAFIDKVEGQSKPLSPAEQLMQQAKFMLEQERVNAAIPVLQEEVKQLKEKQDHTDQIFHLGDSTTIKIYCNMHRIKINTQQAAAVGRQCSKVCRQEKIDITRSVDPTFGTVGVYPVSIIEEALHTLGYT